MLTQDAVPKQETKRFSVESSCNRYGTCCLLSMGIMIIFSLAVVFGILNGTYNGSIFDQFRFTYTNHYNCYSESGNLFHDVGKNFKRIATNERRDQTCLPCGYMKNTSLSKLLNMYNVAECELVISTVLFNGYDKFVPIGNGYDDVPDNCYFVFTDSKAKYNVSRSYTHIYVNSFADDIPYHDGARLTKIFKVIPQRVFKNLRWHVFLAGKTNLRGTRKYSSLLSEFRRSNHSGIIAERHPKRIDLYEEGREVKILKKADPEIVDRQLQDYKHQGYPINFGLLEGHFLFRDFGFRHVQTMSCMWFDEINRGSRRDQLSFNYVIWKLGLEVKYFPYGYFAADRMHTFEGKLSK
jgi:hypothetical protein